LAQINLLLVQVFFSSFFNIFLSIKYHKKKKKADANVIATGEGQQTLLNTRLGFDFFFWFIFFFNAVELDIALPGFLLLDFPSQIRQEKPIGSGGAGDLFTGVLLDQTSLTRFGTNKIVIKHVNCNHFFLRFFFFFNDP